jgi:RHS repeat-associated protein
LGSVSLSTNGSGVTVTSQVISQEFERCGKVRSGGVTATDRTYTGQYLDDTGLLFYNARSYDAGIGRFVSADTVAPGNASGGMDGIAVKPLTVDFHEAGFQSTLNQENGLEFRSPFHI